MTAQRRPHRPLLIAGMISLCLAPGQIFSVTTAHATPANRVALVRYYDRFLARRLDNCQTCHRPSRHPDARMATLSDFPHNPFGDRLRRVAGELSRQNKKTDLVTRLQFIAKEDADGDGVDNHTELLLGYSPGDPKNRPSPGELASARSRQAEFTRFLASYRWQPFDPVVRPPVPDPAPSSEKFENPIDRFLAVERQKRGLRARPEAPRHILLRRLYVDLIGLTPTPEELRAFENDPSPNAYEKVVDRLLADPRYGERWARHWMDIWRYSDWAGWSDGGQIRDSKPHIWRWRDWIIESLNRDKGYDRMVQEMLAADEIAPEDPDALRATGFLVRNFKLLSREKWLEDTVGHTARAFLGITLHCAKCHDHMYDPISQNDYYRVRAIFEPHNVRTDRVPGQLDTTKDGLVRAYDADLQAVTYFFPRGDDRNPDKNRPMTPGVPPVLGGTLQITPVRLPYRAAHPDRRPFVVADTLAASEKAIEAARSALAALPAGADRAGAELDLAIAETKHAALQAVLAVEREEDAGRKGSEAWQQAARNASALQRQQAVLEARKTLLQARQALTEAQAKTQATAGSGDANAAQQARQAEEAARNKVLEAEKALAAAQEAASKPPSTEFKPRPTEDYPESSTGRRLAFARWLTDSKNPLTARVAVNHIWARHFGQGLVPTLDDFGRGGRPPTHPQLLDWLAAEFMARRWSMKALHRLIVTSRAYRMASTPDPICLQRDPDNLYLWRMNPRRMEAEAVRDNLLYVSGSLDPTMGGPEIDHNLGLTSRRRSVYLRIAAEKETEFLKIFDGPSVTECYERRPSVMPQQALALANSELAVREARTLAARLTQSVGSDNGAFVKAAFLQVLSRRPTAEEARLCLDFLARRARSRTQTVAAEGTGTSTRDAHQRARENLVLVLFNHNDFVTVR
ncbi:MAG: DUF1553 domain-containing protein [Chloroherpetonaceae bacterium]|nr:DUF1553 domain-containing protein [Chthonomonadaceae bacterium]MDW8206989.1 DUF1553 domain-containing protein [Chloroherpetonaceae bacterium]